MYYGDSVRNHGLADSLVEGKRQGRVQTVAKLHH